MVMAGTKPSETEVTFLLPTGLKKTRKFVLRTAPSLRALHDIVDPVIGHPMFEHVSVLYENNPCDMFVDEMGHMKGLPRNEEATRIYRTYWLGKHPEAPPESLDYIVGPAVLFHRRVWF